MWLELSIFSISIIFCGIIVYILGHLWFGDTRNRQSKSFFTLGVLVSFWTLMNAIAIVSAEQFFPYMYTLRITMVSIIPFSVFWFILNFAQVRILKYRSFMFLIWFFPVLDALAMLTNPLHHLMFLDYAYPIPTRGIGFWIHTGGDFIALVICFIVLLRHIFKNARKEPLVIAAGFGTFFPYILNMLYTFGARFIPYDITPLGFFITFMLFSLSSYRSQLFNLKAMTLTSIYSLLKDVILVINERSFIMDASPAAAEAFPDFSFNAGQSSLGDFFSYIKNQDSKRIPENLFDPLENGMTERKGELRLHRQDGRLVTFMVTLRTITVRNRPTGSILVMSDVSIYRSMISEINEQNVKLAELRKAAEAASKAKSAFLANMSHEIRTPLNAVIGMALIARKSAKNEKTLNAIGEIETASRHLLGLLNNVLDMSKIESGKFELIQEAFPLKTAMTEVRDLIQQRCEEKNINLEADFECIKNYSVMGDQIRLKQIAINLLGNSVKFTPENGTIAFKLNVIEESDNSVKIHFIVSDNGIGMSEDQLARLFKTFSQADSSIFNRFGGTGLGLSISQNLTHMMGGEITVQSIPGEGSSFEYTLSFPKAGEVREPGDMQGEIVPDLTGKRILLVEDVEINRIILIELLADTHVEIEEAADGEVAVSIFAAKPQGYYDLIFMDIQMPVLDGYEATRRIRAIEAERSSASIAHGFNPETPQLSGQPQEVPIIAMTANAYKEDIEKSLASGMNSHLAKPIDINAVMQVLAEKLAH